MKTYEFMWRLILYRPWLYASNVVSWVLIHISPVLPGLVIREFFDALNGQSRIGFNVAGLVALLMGISLARVANIAIGGLVDIRHRFTMSSLLRRNALENMLLMPAEGPQKSAGETLNVLEEDCKKVEDAISWLVDVTGMTCFAIISAVILMSVSHRLTLMVFLPLIIVIVVAQSASSKLEKYRRQSREATSRVTEAMGEAFNAVQAIKVAMAEERITEHLRVLGDLRRDAMLKDRLLERILDSIFENAAKVGTGLILLIAAKYLRQQSLSVGDFALFVYYLEYVADFAAFLGYFSVHYRQAEVSKDRIGSLIRHPERLVDREPLYLDGELPHLHLVRACDDEKLTSVSVSGLTATHDDGRKGILDVSFGIQGGTFTVVAGRVGSGKTTLIRALIGLMPEVQGEILWNGRRVDDPRSFFTPPKCAYTPQVPHLFSDTLRNNILLGIPPDEANMEDAINTAILGDDISQLENGLDTLIGPKGVKLSGGQQQRAAIARMLIREAELIVFDDVSSALDPDTENKLWDALARKAHATCLVISNRRGAILRADKVLVMKDGGIIAQGPPGELLETCPELRAILIDAK